MYLRELQKYCTDHQYACFSISAATREGLMELVTYVGQRWRNFAPQHARRTFKQATRIVIKIGAVSLRPETQDYARNRLIGSRVKSRCSGRADVRS